MSEGLLVTGPIEIPSALLRFGSDFGEGIERALDEIGEQGTTLYQQEGEAVGARDSGHFIDTIHVRDASRRLTRVIASDASYSGVIEDGWQTRGRGQESYPGRHPAQRAIEKFEPVVQDAFLHQFGRHF